MPEVMEEDANQAESANGGDDMDDMEGMDDMEEEGELVIGSEDACWALPDYSSLGRKFNIFETLNISINTYTFSPLKMTCKTKTVIS